MAKILLRRYRRDVRSPILAGGVLRGQVTHGNGSRSNPLLAVRSKALDKNLAIGIYVLWSTLVNNMICSIIITEDSFNFLQNLWALGR